MNKGRRRLPQYKNRLLKLRWVSRTGNLHEDVQNTELNHASHLLVKTKIKQCWGLRGESRLTQPRTNKDFWIELSSNRKRAASSLKQMCRDKAFQVFPSSVPYTRCLCGVGVNIWSMSSFFTWTLAQAVLSLNLLELACTLHVWVYVQTLLLCTVNGYKQTQTQRRNQVHNLPPSRWLKLPNSTSASVPSHSYRFVDQLTRFFGRDFTFKVMVILPESLAQWFELCLPP